MQRLRRTGRLWILVLLLGAGGRVLPGRVELARGEESVRAEQRDWWSQGWDQISRGRFEQATDIFREAAQAPSADDSVRTVFDWLEAFEDIQQNREELRRQEYEVWVERTESEIARINLKRLVVPLLKPLVERWEEEERAWRDAEPPEADQAAQADKPGADEVPGFHGRETLTIKTEKDESDQKELLELMSDRIRPLLADERDERDLTERFRDGIRGGIARVYGQLSHTRWFDVLGSAHFVYLYAAEQDAFTEGPWMRSIVDRALASAEEKRHEEKWREASGVYYELERIYDGSRKYKKLRLECQTHARLEAMYSKENDWRKRVRGADPDIVGDALHRVSRSYVRAPDFKRIIARGLESVLLITQTPALRDVFEGLNDDLDRTNFVVRVEKLIEKAEREEKLSWRSAIRRYWQQGLVRINQSTIRLPEQVLAVEFMEGALQSLDQFSAVIWPTEVSEFRKYTTGEFTGVGIQINMQGEYITVFSPLEDTPAYRADIRPGDVILKIDGEDAKGMDLNEAVERITGPVGTKVTLTVRHEGEDEGVDVVLERAEILIQTVKGVKRQPDGLNWDYLLDPNLGVAYIRLSGFNKTTVPTLQRVLEEIQSQDARGLILDLRFNPGGLLTAAWKVADTLLPASKIIVRTGGENSADWVKESRGEYADLPLIVLVNERSASASEIVSGAIKDHKRGLIVGERTFGKGSVQNLIPLAGNEALLKLTTAHYYLPSGRCLQREDDSDTWGVEPDIEIRLRPKEIRHLLEVRRNNDVIKPDEEPDDELEDPQGAPKAFDAQLETALLLMRIRLTGGTDWAFPDTMVAVDAMN